MGKRAGKQIWMGTGQNELWIHYRDKKGEKYSELQKKYVKDFSTFCIRTQENLNGKS